MGKCAIGSLWAGRRIISSEGGSDRQVIRPAAHACVQGGCGHRGGRVGMQLPEVEAAFAAGRKTTRVPIICECEGRAPRCRTRSASCPC